MNLRYLELIHAGLAPFDGIICTSRCAEKAVAKGLNRIRELMHPKSPTDLKIEAKLTRIPLGIDETFFNEIDKASARKYFNIPENMVVALSVGRLSLRQKADWSPLLELLARMYSSGNLDNLIFIIAGGAEESDITLMESLISRFGLEYRVMLLPNFKPEIKEKLYKAADFYISIVDNFQETFGINIIEAMASGLPVIASDFSGYRDLVTDGKAGSLIPTTWSDELPEFLKENMGILDPSLAKLYLSQTVSVDLGELENAIYKFYNNEDLRSSMAKAASQRAQTYRWGNIIGSYEAFWSDLATEARMNGNRKVGTGVDLLVGDFQKTFSHYPSRIISDNDIMSITEVGRAVLDGTFSLIKYDDVACCMFPELEKLILHELLKGDQSTGDLKRQAEKGLQATEGQTGFHLQWLLKHGALNLETSSSKNR